MTDEEKAEKYIRTDGTNGEKVWEKIHKEFPNCIVVKSKKSKERLSELLFEYTRVVYLDGLAEGRKESEKLLDKLNLQNQRLNELKNENDYLRNDFIYIIQDKTKRALLKENAELNRDKTELVNSVTELKTKVTELEKQLKNNPYVIQLQKEKAEMAEDFAKYIENLKMVTSSWIMLLEDVRASEVNNRRGEVLREIERRMKELEE